MATTYEKIATTTLGSASSAIDFTSIGSTYTDLRLVITTFTSSATTMISRFNSDSGANYSSTYIAGDGSSASSGRFTNKTSLYAAKGLGSTPQLYTFDIFSYAGSTYKTCLFTEIADNNGSGYVDYFAGLWRSTSAITSINLSCDTTFSAGTTATLYGIKAA